VIGRYRCYLSLGDQIPCYTIDGETRAHGKDGEVVQKAIKA
jgi:hypothetical protein